MLALAQLTAYWSFLGLIVGWIAGFPFGSWVALALLALQLALGPRLLGKLFNPSAKGGFAATETHPDLACCDCDLPYFGVLGDRLWVTRGFLEAPLEHERLLELARGCGLGLASRALAFPVALRRLCWFLSQLRMSPGPQPMDLLVTMLRALAWLLEWPLQALRPPLQSELEGAWVERAVSCSAPPPAWLESLSLSSPLSLRQLRGLARSAAARGWRTGDPWVDPQTRPAGPVHLPLAGALLGLAAMPWGGFGVPVFAWGLLRLGMFFWFFRPGAARPLEQAWEDPRLGGLPVSLEGTLGKGLEGLLSDPREVFLDDGQRRLPYRGEKLVKVAWLLGERLIPGGRARYLLSGLAALFFGGWLTALWWLGV